MANTKITQLPSASIATGSNVLPIVQGGDTDQITVTNLGQGILNLGLSITGSTVTANNNSSGTNFKVGDDAWIGDVDIANTMQVAGVQDATKGFIKFSSGSASPIIGSAGNNIFQITGSTRITGSGFINGNAILTSADTGSFYTTGSYGFYGAFCSTGSQTNPVVNVSRSMALETTELSDGVSITSGSRITVANAGIYNLEFSAQLEKTDNGTDTVYIWFKKNGSNVARSNTAIDVTKNAGGGGKTVAAWNYVDNYNAGDYVEIVWQSADIAMQLTAAVATGNLPAIPSVIATLTQVS
jgi:hypothetical protein